MSLFGGGDRIGARIVPACQEREVFPDGQGQGWGVEVRAEGRGDNSPGVIDAVIAAGQFDRGVIGVEFFGQMPTPSPAKAPQVGDEFQLPGRNTGGQLPEEGRLLGIGPAGIP